MAKDADVIQRKEAADALHQLSQKHEKRVAELVVRIQELEIALESSRVLIGKLQKELKSKS